MSKWLLSKEEMERIIKEVAIAQARKIIDELEKEVQVE